MNVYNLIGPIGSGKSEAQKILESLDYQCFCADNYVRELYKKKYIIDDIKKIFPKVIENNKINTNLLRQIIFNDITKMNENENYTQPIVFKEFNSLINKNNKDKKIFFVIPITKKNKFIDKYKKIYINADEVIRKKRLEKRTSYDIDIINKIIKYQNSIDDYKSNCDFYIENNSTLLSLKKNINKILVNI